MHIYLCSKSCILVPDDGSEGPKEVAFSADVVKRLLYLTVTCMPVLMYLLHTIITPTKCTLLLLKAPDITICALCLIFRPCMFQPAWVIFRGLNTSAWLKLLLITIY
jgi:hypothetical protein